MFTGTRLLSLALCGLATTAAEVQAGTKVKLKVESEPSGAMVTVSAAAANAAAAAVAVAGVTPFEKTFEFPKKGGLLLTLEKRGYTPRQLEIQPTSGDVRVTLDRVSDTEVAEYALPRSGAVLLVQPEIDVIKRGFSSEKADSAASSAAGLSLQAAAERLLAGRFEVRRLTVSEETREPLRSLWRDGRTVMQLTDPIRLPYLARPLYLETRSSRRAAGTLTGGVPQAQLLLIQGKQVQDTAGMKIGQLAVLSAGTASSYASGYTQALQRGDSFFIYNVYTPDFTSGLTLKAALVEGDTGEVVWVNRGNWKAARFDQIEAVVRVVEELLAGLL